MVDCDDTNELVHPGITQENCSTSDDDNCDGKRNCEDDQCRISLGELCDAQCDQDGDGRYKATCGGNDCNDNCGLCFPGFGQPPHGNDGEASGTMFGVHCGDGNDNDCDDLPDCLDPDCFDTVSCEIYDPDSPVVIDVLGNGFNLTDFAGGVIFDLDRDGTPEQLSWTSANSDDAWVVLDRNGNGTIDDGKELFGNFSPQPDPPVGVEKNGFLALRVFDRPGKGGNDDGIISREDDVFSKLRLWQDTNHNGISEPSELKRLRDLGLRKIDLDYQESDRLDQHGNAFKYRARVRDAQDAQLGRWAWDVYLLSNPSQ